MIPDEFEPLVHQKITLPDLGLALNILPRYSSLFAWERPNRPTTTSSRAGNHRKTTASAAGSRSLRFARSGRDRCVFSPLSGERCRSTALPCHGDVSGAHIYARHVLFGEPSAIVGLRFRYLVATWFPSCWAGAGRGESASLDANELTDSDHRKQKGPEAVSGAQT
jgi:hypothetical protein